MSTALSWRRRQDRLAALFPLVAVALFAALTFWLDARVSESARAQKAASAQAPDHFLEGFRVERTDARGHVESSMTGALAAHFPNARSTVVNDPRYEGEPSGKPKLSVRAQRAVLFSAAGQDGIEEIDFSGKVLAEQAASPGRDAVTYQSEALTVFPKTQQARTEALTRTVSGDRVMVTQGLHVDAEKKQGQTHRGIEIELRPKEGATRP
ncbi:MAG: LPS export ABC transporter periplasmic protein LptC [Burkholderiales bacterium]|nr:LPS export ABC transporter periplasmic protein LptC [Burkholderiales bacterium]